MKVGPTVREELLAVKESNQATIYFGRVLPQCHEIIFSTIGYYQFSFASDLSAVTIIDGRTGQEIGKFHFTWYTKEVKLTQTETEIILTGENEEITVEDYPESTH